MPEHLPGPDEFVPPRPENLDIHPESVDPLVAAADRLRADIANAKTPEAAAAFERSARELYQRAGVSYPEDDVMPLPETPDSTQEAA